MREYQAIFFDRDGTLAHKSPQQAKERDRAIGGIVGNPHFELSSGERAHFFWLVMQPLEVVVNTLDREREFWQRWYQLILEANGLVDGAESRAAELYEKFPFHEMMQPFPETTGVLRALEAHGFRMGAISDTFPSLEASLEAMGIARYFESFTASSVVGAGKPDPKIFQAAVQSLGATPHESIFVDDTKEEVDAARDLGFTAFHLDRERKGPDFPNWTISNLRQLLDFLHIQ